MTDLAPHITAYLRQRLPVERAASPHTCDTYAYAFQLLFNFASQKLGVPPSALQLEHLEAPLVLEFLEHLVQVKYEMVRQVRVEGHPVSHSAAAFGFSRPSFYQAQALLGRSGMAALCHTSRSSGGRLHDRAVCPNGGRSHSRVAARPGPVPPAPSASRRQARVGEPREAAGGGH